MAEDMNPTRAADARALAALEDALRRARRIGRGMLVLQAIGVVGAWVVAALLLIGMLDFAVRTPWFVRCVLVGTAAVVGGWHAWSMLGRAATFRPTLVEVALRLEGTEAGKQAGLSGRLASAVELAHDTTPTGLGVGMVQRLVAEMSVAAGRIPVVSSLISPRETLHRVGLLGLAVLPVLALGMKSPEYLAIGAQRVLTPWSETPWPNRFMVVDATLAAAHSVHAALPLRAVVTRTPREAGQTDVLAELRIVRGREKSDWKRVLLTGQGKTDAATEAALAGVSGELYERLIEPVGIDGSLDQALDAGEEIKLEYRLSAGDSQTQIRSLILARPPRLLGAHIAVEGPEYAQGALAGTRYVVTGETPLDMGPGTDQRRIVGPVLAGSQMRVRLKFDASTPPLAPPSSDAEQVMAFVQRALPGLNKARVREVEPGIWEINATAQETLAWKVAAQDRFGLGVVEDVNFKVEVSPDALPLATVMDPSQDEQVLATARLTIKGEATDDVGITSAAMATQVWSVPVGSEARVLEARGEPMAFASTSEPAPAGAGSGRGVRLTGDLTIADLAGEKGVGKLLAAGDEVWVTVEARDGFVSGEARHEMVRSAPRKLRIITPSTLIEQIKNELSAVRQTAQRLSQDQSAAAGKLREAGDPERDAQQRSALAGEVQRRQESISERLGPQAELLSRVAQRMERNVMADATLQSLVQDAQQAVQKARSASERAKENAAGAAAQKSEDAASRQEASARRDAAGEAQKEAARELARLADMLGQSQDAWAARRNVEQMLSDQKQLSEQTRALSEQTAGKSPEQLSNEQREELSRLAQEQRDLAAKVNAAIEQMSDQAQKLAQSSPAQAEAMKASAQEGRRNQTSDTQKQAAEQIERNQNQSANQLQQKAEKSLEQMLKELERGEQKRDEALRRVLAEIAQTLDGLIQRQQSAIEALTAGIKGNVFTGLDGPMLQLHSATLSVTDDVRANRELAPLVEYLEAAGTAQGGAITALRATPVNATVADTQERTSLQRLTEAKERAQRLQEQAADRDMDRQREELAKAYAELLARQTELRNATQPLIGKDVNRRDRQTVLGLGQTQAQIRQETADLRSKTEFLADAKVFDFAHRRLDALMSGASEALAEGSAPISVKRDQDAAVRTLAGLVESLKNSKRKKNDDFRDAPGGGGGGGGGGGEQKKPRPVPPLAELRVIRSMQQDIAERTRELAEGAADKVELERLGAFQRELADQARELIERMKDESDQGGGS